MLRQTSLLLAVAMFLVVAPTHALADGPDDGTFLVRHRGYAVLGPDGEEKDRLESHTKAAGGFSPNGRWVAFCKVEPNASPGKWQRTLLVIQSRDRHQERTTVPAVWGIGSSFLPIWSSDSSQILICERGRNEAGAVESAYRVYDLVKRNLTHLNVPNECWVNDWSVEVSVS